MTHSIAGMLRAGVWCALAMMAGCGGGSSSQSGGVPPGGGDGSAPGSSAAQNLRELRDANGDSLDVALLIIGHSTSLMGDYPAKLAAALNANTIQDGRNYVVFDGITTGDGGFLWDFLMLAPSDPQYARVANTTQGKQWDADSANNRWSCRRLKLERSFSTVDPVDPSVCRESYPPEMMRCKYTEAGQTKTEDLSVAACWSKMDLHIALVQDTTNRSFPVDDFNASGALDAADFLPLDTAAVADYAVPCGAGTPNPFGYVSRGGSDYLDFNCDGALNDFDLPHKVYATWLHDLSEVLLTQYAVDHVFISQKPVEFGFSCTTSYYYPGEETACGPHMTRIPTGNRPFAYFYTPTVYWEFGALVELFAAETDNRVHLATYGSVTKMWDRSAQCYTLGLLSSDFTIPLDVGRPADVQADMDEIDAVPPNAPSGSNTVGCMVQDHTHHTDAGGWMMADVWYKGLLDYLF